MTKISGCKVAVGTIVAVGSFIYGFGFASFATSIGQPGFFRYLNLSNRGWGAYTNYIIRVVNTFFFFFGASVGALGVRIIRGSSLRALATLVPIYLSDASTNSKRGMLTGLNGFLLLSGYSASAWVGFGCFSDKLTFGWRGPLAFTYISSLILLIGYVWIPESPRWPLARGFRDPNDLDGIAAHEESYQMRKQIEFESANPSGYTAIFKTPATYMPLLIYCIYALIGALGNLFSLLTVDRLTEDSFIFFYGLFIDAASFIYSSEIYPTNIRSPGVAMATFTYVAVCITFVTPGATAIANIGYKYFAIFACLAVISVIVIYFMYPETKGKSLGELAELFGNPVVVHLTDAAEENELFAEHQEHIKA
ncbi:MFS general substrate transporter [Zopfia rhizophila CBS 207.26]|uniref:MFS general substrate transporter n=1 Tax=Zopfia rhizophila CBS 207.26 TaxID=1314779 RepID=A0A6A6DIR0_9PEZI|nr:MFS general substrate transporter [Zopfia rhizophila CBS 207.26]